MMKQIDLEYYHIIKGRLTDTIAEYNKTESAENAAQLLMSIDMALEKRIEKSVGDSAEVLRRLNHMLRAELDKTTEVNRP